MRKRLLAFAIFTFPCFGQAAGIIDAKRYIDWTQAGAGTIPTTRTQCGATIAAYGSSGARQSAATVETAFNACAANTFVLLGPGTFFINTTPFLTKANVTLRASGPQGTIWDTTAGSTCGESHPAAICFAGGNDSTDGSNPENICTSVSGYTQGSTTLTCTTTTGSHQPVVGQLVEMNGSVDGTNTAADTFPEVFGCILATGNCTQASSGTADGTPASFGGVFQIFRITNVSGTCTGGCTLTVTPPVHMPNWGIRTVRIWWQNQTAITGVGLENLQIKSGNPIVGFRWATQSWMQNVELNNTSAVTAPHYVLLTHTSQVTVRDSYWFGSGDSSNDEYGIDCYACSSTLAENNIISKLRMWFSNEMGEGNVIDYNYHILNYTAQGGSTGTGGSCSGGTCSAAMQGGLENHGCCNGYTLAEGNDFASFQFDNYFGNIQFATLFRNRVTGATILDTIGNTGNTSPIEIGPLGRFSNLVGNVNGSGQPGYVSYVWQNGTCNPSTYIFLMGGTCPGQGVADTKSYTSSFLWGNWDSFNNATRFVNGEVPSGANGGNYTNAIPATHNLPASFLYGAPPPWWGVTGQSPIPWPAIGSDITGGNYGCSGQNAGCTGGGFANKIPARLCFESLGGTFSNTTVIPFDANTCYTATVPTPARNSAIMAKVFTDFTGNNIH